MDSLCSYGGFRGRRIPWLQLQNPFINWETKEITFPSREKPVTSQASYQDTECTTEVGIFVTIYGVNYCQEPCSLDNLIKNLSFPNPNVRPVKNWTTVTEVSIGMSLYSVIELETNTQTLSTLVWFSMTWKNEFIGWDPKQFCSLEKLFTSKGTFWKPDLYVYERVDGEDKYYNLPFYSLEYTGQIKFSLPLKISSTCGLMIYNFPFDTQKCSLTFGPYNYPAEEILMVTNTTSSEVLNDSRQIFVSRGDWTLRNITVKPINVSIGNVNYSAIYYEITLQRIPIIYVMTLIVPAFFLVILDIVSMFMQMDSGERIGFKITLVLGFSVLLLILNTMLPISEVPPVLGIFCCVVMAVMVISILGCVAVSYMIMLSETQPTVPLWIKCWILKYLARILCFKRKSFMKYGITFPEVETYVNSREVEEQRLESERKFERDKKDSTEVKMLKMLLLQVKKIHKNIVESGEINEVMTEWHAAAIVVDRLIVIIYLCIVFILFVTVFIIWFR
ncbi:5-hydroxytryptamine receptor 3A-like [Dendrobates tinctorius]|uniref:5-hydroxytryptamine receptor 3A-like n=1 Tax=Dendrobates tinctorius TaxID=92724 RepID=UPI003CCA286B